MRTPNDSRVELKLLLLSGLLDAYCAPEPGDYAGAALFPHSDRHRTGKWFFRICEWASQTTKVDVAADDGEPNERSPSQVFLTLRKKL
jgi:hypothetical protein